MKDIEVVKQDLEKEIKKYVEIITTEYKDIIPDKVKKIVTSIDLKQHIFICETNTITLYVRNYDFYFPISACKIFEAMKKLPYYGSNKNHVCYTKETLIKNDNTFNTFIKHCFIKGMDYDDYYKEILLHEVMHFCSSNGGSALEEGINELKTREVALKYNLLTNGCGYPKEVDIALRLQEIFGKEVLDKLSFSKSLEERKEILDTVSSDAITLYEEVRYDMEKEFREKYYKYKFPGILGPLKKTMKYKQIDYSKVIEKIENYKQSKTIKQHL